MEEAYNRSTSPSSWIDVDQQAIMPKGRPDRWHECDTPFITQCTPGGGSSSSSTRRIVHNRSTLPYVEPPPLFGNDDDDDDEDSMESSSEPLQIVPRPWRAPAVSQEIVDEKLRWLGGCTPMTPINRRDNVGGSKPIRGGRGSIRRDRPEPIHIEGYSSSVKDSPFFQ